MTVADGLPRTRAEISDYQETSRHSDVLAFVQDLCSQTPLVQRTSLGKSGEGQDMVALVVSDGTCFTPEEAKKQKRLIVMIEANIHSGEVEGKESVLALVRDITLVKPAKKLLSRICLVVIPNFNPDGNDRISPNNRRLNIAELEGQVNPPGGVGTRYTGEGWNLNRDAVKQEAVETQNLARFFGHWWPHVFIDCHTTDGSLHAFDLTFDTSHSNQRMFRPLLRKTRSMLEEVSKTIQVTRGFSSYWYGNFVEESNPDAGWETYPALPRFGSHYRGLLGRIDVLLETYSYLPYQRRCDVMYAWLAELCRYCTKHAEELRNAVEGMEALIIERCGAFDPRARVGVDYGVARRGTDGQLLFDYPAHARDGDEAVIESFDKDSLRDRKYPGESRVTYRVPHRRTFVPTHQVSIPSAYLVPAQLAERLRGHGIAFEALEEETEMEVTGYRVWAIERTHSPDVAGLVPPLGQAEIPLSAKPPPRRFETVVTARTERRKTLFAAGTLVVSTAQRAGILAVYLLEPCSDDGFTRWQMLDAHLHVGQFHPVHRVDPL